VHLLQPISEGSLMMVWVMFIQLIQWAVLFIHARILLSNAK
jgi:hypothetical protein